ncbi:DUF2867 domain-containing protein [Streptomyces sp. NA02950]|uniref:DUF2867 domain-containing protein n=1 Tax=Streptomyces sp. NA02950 TaxID=2742137 RepID=UPI00158FBAD3|nr:DUF2867 domain-containing protein [Streptomyces sp. NA02950]QKV96541.1 DUF2867 domain-containing protein [Streptomyces sp. NA02950]
MATARARRVDIPRALQDGHKFTGFHYESAYQLPVEEARKLTPEQWGRATFEDAPAVLRWFLRFGWTKVLGLRMGPKTTSPRHVLGWHIADSDDGMMTIEAHSGIVATYNIVLVNDGDVVWVTFVRFNKGIARAVWGMAKPVHQMAVPYLLKRADRSRATG